MTASNTNNSPNATFGFITVVELESIGHCGGLLIVSQIGRPIEFHCTAPVLPNRAQEIMYGQTYNGFLVADQIGMAMVDKSKHQPTMFVTDCADMLPITEMMDAPLIFAEANSTEAKSMEDSFDSLGLTQIQINDYPVYCINAQSDQIEFIQARLQRFAATLPLDEPFERIRQAIEEAHTGIRAA